MASLEIMQRLHALEAQAAELREQLEATRIQEQTEYAKEIADYCEECEWDQADIAKLLLPKRERSATGKGSSRGAPRGSPRPIKNVWVNPRNPDQIYKGRGFPGWMHDEMMKLGMDTDSKESRIEFREKHLVEKNVDEMTLDEPAESVAA